VEKRNAQARSTVPPRYAFRLEDLRVFHLVRASCHACGHKAVIPNAALQQGRSSNTRLMSLEGQLPRDSRAAGNAEREARPRSRWNCGLGIEFRKHGGHGTEAPGWVVRVDGKPFMPRKAEESA
jgi:hypothetical protein